MKVSQSLSQNCAILKAIAHPLRLKIVRYLVENGQSNVTTLIKHTKEPQANVSQHLAKLRLAKVVDSDRYRNEILYSVSNKTVIEVINAVFKK